MKLVIHLVTWNGAAFIPYVADSLRRQTFQDWTLRVLDNNSTDKTKVMLEKEFADVADKVELHYSKKNLGFAGGHNELFASLPDSAGYVLLLNQDLYLNEECLERLVSFMNTHDDAAAIAPRLMRWNTAKMNDDGADSDLMFSNYIDSLGIKMHRSRRVTELGAYEKWTGSYKGKHDALKVFGVSGTMPLIRIRDAKQVSYDGVLFDPLYTSYKEDIDLMYRFQEIGKSVYTVLGAFAHHARSAGEPTGKTDFAAAENKRLQTEQTKIESYKNHLMNIYKHTTWYDWLVDGWAIWWYEGKKKVWLLLFDRKTFVDSLKFIKAHWNELKAHKVAVRSRITMSPKKLRKRLCVSSPFRRG